MDNQLGTNTVIVPWLQKTGETYPTNERLYSTVNIGEGTLGQNVSFFKAPLNHSIEAIGVGAPTGIRSTAIDTNMLDFGRLAKGRGAIVKGMGIVLKLRADDEAAAAAAVLTDSAAHPLPPFPFINSNIMKRFQRDTIVVMRVNNNKLFEAPLSYFNQGVNSFVGAFGPAVNGAGTPGYDVASNGGSSRHSRRLLGHFPTLSSNQKFSVDLVFPKREIRGLVLGNMDAADPPAPVPGINCFVEAKCYFFGEFWRKA